MSSRRDFLRSLGLAAVAAPVAVAVVASAEAEAPAAKTTEAKPWTLAEQIDRGLPLPENLFPARPQGRIVEYTKEHGGLQIGREVTFDPHTRTVHLHRRGLLAEPNSKVSLNMIYSAAQYWLDDPAQMDTDFFFRAITPHIYELEHAWTIDPGSRDLIRMGAWTEWSGDRGCGAPGRRCGESRR